MRSTRFDPSLDAALEAAATAAGVSVNALVSTFVAEGLAKHYTTNSAVTYTAAAATSDTFAGSNLLASSVQNYPQTLATVRNSFQDAVSALSGKPEEEEPHD